MQIKKELEQKEKAVKKGAERRDHEISDAGSAYFEISAAGSPCSEMSAAGPGP